MAGRRQDNLKLRKTSRFKNRTMAHQVSEFDAPFAGAGEQPASHTDVGAYIHLSRLLYIASSCCFDVMVEYSGECGVEVAESVVCSSAWLLPSQVERRLSTVGPFL